MRAEGKVLAGGTSSQRDGEQAELIAPGSSLHTQLAGVAWPRGRARTSKRHRGAGGLLLQGWRLHQRLLQLLQWQHCDPLLQT